MVDIDVLYQQLLEVRRTGIAQEKEENYEFVQCIATPLYKNGKPVLALSISFPTFRYTEAEKTFAGCEDESGVDYLISCFEQIIHAAEYLGAVCPRYSLCGV